MSLAESLAVQLKSRMEAWNERVTSIGDLFVHLVGFLASVVQQKEVSM